MKFSRFNEETDQLIQKHFRGALCNGYLNCESFMLPDLFPKNSNEILNFQIRDDDVWLCSYPKAGSTWSQETIWCILNNLNFEKSNKINLSARFPFLDAPFVVNAKLLTAKDPEIMERIKADSKLRMINAAESPRFVKSHLPRIFLPLKLQRNSTKAKIIYIIRNPRDTCISQFHHCKSFEGFQNSFEEFADLFMKGLVPYGPYWKSVFSYWNQRSNLNILIVKFEEMKTNLHETIEKIAKFLNHDLTTDELDELAQHVTFDNMKTITSVNKEKMTSLFKMLNNVKDDTKFMRSGQINQWRDKMSPELIQKFEQWERENLKDTDYVLTY